MCFLIKFILKLIFLFIEWRKKQYCFFKFWIFSIHKFPNELLQPFTLTAMLGIFIPKSIFFFCSAQAEVHNIILNSVHFFLSRQWFWYGKCKALLRKQKSFRKISIENKARMKAIVDRIKDSDEKRRNRECRLCLTGIGNTVTFCPDKLRSR